MQRFFWGIFIAPGPAGRKRGNPARGPPFDLFLRFFAIGRSARLPGAGQGRCPGPARFFVKKRGKKLLRFGYAAGGEGQLDGAALVGAQEGDALGLQKLHDLLVRVAVAVAAPQLAMAKAGGRRRISSSVELELPWWPSLSTSQLRSKPPSAAQSASAPEEMSPVKSMALPPYSTRRTRLESFKSSPQSETGPTNWNSAPPRVKTLPRGGTVMYRPRSAAVSSKRVKAPEESNSV